MNANHNLIKALAATVEITNTVISGSAKKIMIRDLSEFPLPQVLASLKRCRKELKGRLTIADVVSRLDDGRPLTEKAWLMIPGDEESSVVWTEEMAEAFGSAIPLIQAGDQIAARMAFKESYSMLVNKARDEAKPVKWTVSFGSNKEEREDAVIDAVQSGRLTHQRAIELIPYSERLLESSDVPQLENQNKVKALMGKINILNDKDIPIPKKIKHKSSYDEHQVLEDLEKHYQSTD